MTLWIALLRGVNMGGHHKLPMKTLPGLLAPLGCTDVRTYIQSGNLVFRHEGTEAATLAQAIAEAIGAAHGFQPATLLLTREALERAVAANPFPHAESAPKSLHLFFLEEPPAQPDLAAIKRLKRDTEAYVLDGTTFYLHAPEGIAPSKLAARVPALLGVEATGRNWRTVTAVLELARALA